METRRFLTHNSLWLFDEDASTFCRVPREDAKEAELNHVPYVGEWQEFERLDRVNNVPKLRWRRCGEWHELWVVRGPKIHEGKGLEFWPIVEGDEVKRA